MRGRLILIFGALVVVAVGALWFFSLGSGSSTGPDKTPPAPAARPAPAPPPVASAPEAPSNTPASPAPGKRPAKEPARPTDPAPPAAAEAAPTTGTIRFTSDVGDTSVFIDRQYVGTAPITAPNITPGSHQLKMVAAGYDSLNETIEVAAGSRDYDAKFKEVKLDARIEVTHKHAMGSCAGTLIATPQGLRYDTTSKDDAFTVAFSELETFEVDYLNKNLKVTIKKGKTYNFTNGDANADRLYTFHSDVEKARKKLGK